MKKEIDGAIEEFAGSLRLKHKLEDTATDLRVKRVKEKVKNKIVRKNFTQIYNTSSVLQEVA